jgi:hypothetical protein
MIAELPTVILDKAFGCGMLKGFFPLGVEKN